MTELPLLLVLVVVTIVFGLAGLWQVQAGRARQNQLYLQAARLDARAGLFVEFLDRLDTTLRATPPGRTMGRRLRAAMVPMRVLDFTLLMAAGAVAIMVLLSSVVPLPIAAIAAALAFWVAWWVLGLLRERRVLAFVLQQPELARLLANAGSSGLSLPAAIALAGDELEEPAATELRVVSEQLRLGVPLAQALTDLTERMHSREVGVLTRTLILQFAMGGDLVAALRTLADTLDARRDLLRELTTLLAPSRLSGVLVATVGVGSLALIETLGPGTIETMVTTPVGLALLGVSGAIFAVAFWLVGRITRVDI